MAKQQADKFDQMFGDKLKASSLVAVAAAPHMPGTGSGKRAGKRSDPEWDKFTLLLKKTTHKAAKRKAEDDFGKGQDLSNVAEKLLSKWVDGSIILT
jgi:hypothetical protein